MAASSAATTRRRCAASAERCGVLPDTCSFSNALTSLCARYWQTRCWRSCSSPHTVSHRPSVGIDLGFLYWPIFGPLVSTVALIPASVSGFGVDQVGYVYIMGMVGRARSSSLRCVSAVLRSWPSASTWASVESCLRCFRCAQRRERAALQHAPGARRNRRERQWRHARRGFGSLVAPAEQERIHSWYDDHAHEFADAAVIEHSFVGKSPEFQERLNRFKLWAVDRSDLVELERQARARVRRRTRSLGACVPRHGVVHGRRLLEKPRRPRQRATCTKRACPTGPGSCTGTSHRSTDRSDTSTSSARSE